MAIISFQKWANNENINEALVYDFLYYMVGKYNLEIGYENDIRNVHLYFEKFVILHLSVRDRYIFVLNRFANSANKKLPHLAKLKFSNVNRELYENLNANEVIDVLGGGFHSKELILEDSYKIGNYIDYAVKKIVPSIRKINEDFVFSERVKEQDLALMKIYINENLYVNDLQNLLNSVKDLYSTLLFIFKFNIENSYDDNLHKCHDFLENIDESKYADDRLILNNIIVGSEGAVVFAGLKTFFDLINSLIEIYRKTKEISILTLESTIKEVKLKDAITECAFNDLQRLMTLTKDREDEKNARFIGYIDIQIRTLVESLEQYAKDPRSFDVRR